MIDLLKGQFTPEIKSVRYIWDMESITIIKKSFIILKLIKKPFFNPTHSLVETL